MLDQISVDDLKQRLEEKQQTVAQLTEYLEQAAKKLDALKEEKAAGKPAKAFDSEMVDRQMELVKQLQAAVDEWDELAVPSVMDRMSSRLENLRQTILDGLRTTTPPGGMSGGYSYPERESRSEGEDDKETGDALAGWEALKAEMLGEEPEAAKDEKDQLDIDLQEEMKVLVNRPAGVDQDCRDQSVWVEAVDSREKYIISLLRALRVVENRRRGNPDWESFTLASPVLREYASQLAVELQQMQRNAEVELSIERARISRQESVIAQRRREIDKAQKKQGANPQLNTAEPAPTGEGRWQKFLGRGKNGG